MLSFVDGTTYTFSNDTLLYGSNISLIKSNANGSNCIGFALDEVTGTSHGALPGFGTLLTDRSKSTTDVRVFTNYGTWDELRILSNALVTSVKIDGTLLEISDDDGSVWTGDGTQLRGDLCLRLVDGNMFDYDGTNYPKFVRFSDGSNHWSPFYFSNIADFQKDYRVDVDDASTHDWFQELVDMVKLSTNTYGGKTAAEHSDTYPTTHLMALFARSNYLVLSNALATSTIYTIDTPASGLLSSSRVDNTVTIGLVNGTMYSDSESGRQWPQFVRHFAGTNEWAPMHLSNITDIDTHTRYYGSRQYYEEVVNYSTEFGDVLSAYVTANPQDFDIGTIGKDLITPAARSHLLTQKALAVFDDDVPEVNTRIPKITFLGEWNFDYLYVPIDTIKGIRKTLDGSDDILHEMNGETLRTLNKSYPTVETMARFVDYMTNSNYDLLNAAITNLDETMNTNFLNKNKLVTSARRPSGVFSTAPLDDPSIRDGLPTVDFVQNVLKSNVYTSQDESEDTIPAFALNILPPSVTYMTSKINNATNTYDFAVNGDIDAGFWTNSFANENLLVTYGSLSNVMNNLFSSTTMKYKTIYALTGISLTGPVGDMHNIHATLDDFNTGSSNLMLVNYANLQTLFMDSNAVYSAYATNEYKYINHFHLKETINSTRVDVFDTPNRTGLNNTHTVSVDGFYNLMFGVNTSGTLLQKRHPVTSTNQRSDAIVRHDVPSDHLHGYSNVLSATGTSNFVNDQFVDRVITTTVAKSPSDALVYSSSKVDSLLQTTVATAVSSFISTRDDSDFNTDNNDTELVTWKHLKSNLVEPVDSAQNGNPYLVKNIYSRSFAASDRPLLTNVNYVYTLLDSVANGGIVADAADIATYYLDEATGGNTFADSTKALLSFKGFDKLLYDRGGYEHTDLNHTEYKLKLINATVLSNVLYSTFLETDSTVALSDTKTLSSRATSTMIDDTLAERILSTHPVNTRLVTAKALSDLIMATYTSSFAEIRSTRVESEERVLGGVRSGAARSIPWPVDANDVYYSDASISSYVEYIASLNSDGSALPTASPSSGGGAYSSYAYGSALESRMLADLAANSEKILNFGSLYSFTNDFYEMKRLTTTSFDDIVTNSLYSRNMLVNSRSAYKESLLTVGWNNGDSANYRESDVMEVTKDGDVVIEGNLFLGRKKWKLSALDDSLVISKYDHTTRRYVQKHVFT
jgi:hypothetical protein